MVNKATVRLRFRIAAFAVLVAGLLAAIALDVTGSTSEAFRIAYGSIAITMGALLVADYSTVPGE